VCDWSHPGCNGSRHSEQAAEANARLLSSENYRGQAKRDLDYQLNGVVGQMGDVKPEAPALGLLKQNVPELGGREFGLARTKTGNFAIVPMGSTIYRVAAIKWDRDAANRDQPATLDELQAAICRVIGIDLPMQDAVWLSRITDSSRLAERRGGLPTRRSARVAGQAGGTEGRAFKGFHGVDGRGPEWASSDRATKERAPCIGSNTAARRGKAQRALRFLSMVLRSGGGCDRPRRV